MNRDDIIRMALKCGAMIKSDCEGNGAFGDGIDLLQFAALVAAAEREACAQIAFLANSPLEATMLIRERGAP